MDGWPGQLAAGNTSVGRPATPLPRRRVPYHGHSKRSTALFGYDLPQRDIVAALAIQNVRRDDEPWLQTYFRCQSRNFIYDAGKFDDGARCFEPCSVISSALQRRRLDRLMTEIISR